jgi:uracil-DNA glycosylase
MDVKIESSWKQLLKDEFEKKYFSELTDFVKAEYQSFKIYPPAGQIFNAFELCPIDKIKVVIIGQDPYHGAGQANGLCFSVSDKIKKPPSLINIFKEIHSDLGIEIPDSGNLERWAKQGVFLLNATLTVRADSPASHQNKGWETFTDSVIQQISEKKENIVFILWGAYAQKKKLIIDSSKHLILESAHPSPFAANKGFFGNKHFSRTNQYLKNHSIKEIIW